MRRSIQPTYDHRETGDRFYVETRVDGDPVGKTTCRDPFVFHRVTVKLGLRHLLRRKVEVVMIVGADHEMVDDVMELDADCLTNDSSRRHEFNADLNVLLRDIGQP